MSPLASWIVFPVAVAGVVALGLVGTWYGLKFWDWCQAVAYERRKQAREAFHGAQARVMGPYASKVVPFRRQG